MTQGRQQKWIGLSMLISLIAIGIYYYQMDLHYDLSLGLQSGKSVCNINAVFNCEVVDSSPYAKLFGIPLALWGLYTNLCLLALLTLATMSEESVRRERLFRFSFTLSSFIFFVSLVMGTISATKLNTLCLLCLIQYALSFVSWLALFLSLPLSEKRLNRLDLQSLISPHQGLRIVLVLLFLVPTLSFMTHAIVFKSKKDLITGSGVQFDPMDSIKEWQATAPIEIDESQGLIMGSENPKLTLIEFADFLCSHCRHFAPTLKSFVQTHPDVRLVFFTFPLDGQCNPEIPARSGKSCELAKILECAKEQNKGWPVQNALFEMEPQELENALFIQKFGEKFGLSNLQECVRSDSTHQKVLAQAAIGKAAKIQATPTVFANKRLLPNAQIRLILDFAHQHAQNQK